MDEAIDSIGAISQRKNDFDIVSLSEFSVNSYINSKLVSIVAIMSAKEYDKALSENTEYGWQKFKESVPEKYCRDVNGKLNVLYSQSWGTEYKAWKSAIKENTVDAYSKYLDLYPKGEHARPAEKIIVNLSVQDVFNSNSYGRLPSMRKTYAANSSMSKVSVGNNTGYTLTSMYSGPDSRRLAISPYSQKVITLLNGTYRITASVSVSNVRPFAGIETLTGGGYDVSYYISSRYY